MIVNIYKIGRFLDLDIKKLVKLLNQKTESLLFVYVREENDELKILKNVKKDNSIFYDPKDVIHALKQSYKSNQELHVGLSAVWFADQDAGQSMTLNDIYFGYWRNQFVSDAPRGYAIISIAPWISKYEVLSKRDRYQYVAWLIVSFIGDYLVEGGLTHGEFRWCAYDYNPDLESIIWSMGKAQICEECGKKIQAYSEKGEKADLDNTSSLHADLLNLCVYVRRLSFLNVFRKLQENAAFSIFFVGLFMAVMSGIIADNIGNKDFHGGSITIGFSAIFLLVLIGMILCEKFRWLSKYR